MRGLKALGWVAVALVGSYAIAVLAVFRGETVNAVWFVVAAVAVYTIAYRFYGAFLAARVFAPPAGSRSSIAKIHWVAPIPRSAPE